MDCHSGNPARRRQNIVMTKHQPNPSTISQMQVTSLLRKTPGLILLDMVIAVLLILFALFVARNYESTAYLWFLAVMTLCTLRAAFTIYFQRMADQMEHLKKIELFILLGSLFSGLMWGTTWLIHPGLDEFIAPRGTLLIAPALILSSAVVNLALVRKAFFALAIPAVTLQIIYLLYLGGQLNILFAAGFTCVLAMSSVLALNIYKEKVSAIEANLLIQKLRSDLQDDAEKLKNKESELLERITREQKLIKEKRRTDHQLQEAYEERLLLLDAINEGILGISRSGKISFINPAALSMLNLKESQAIDKEAVTLLSPSTTLSGIEAITRKALMSCIEEGKPLQATQGVFTGADNSLLPVSFSCRPLKKENAYFGIVLSFADQTKQKEMEAKLVASQKMEAMGRMTGGVAHDFNNLLTVIIGNLQFLKRRYFKDDSGNGVELVDKVMSAAKSGAELNSRLLSYSKEQSLQNEATDVKKLLKEMGNFLNRILGEEISIRFEFGKDPAVAMIDRHQFENVVMNLCLNARDAMPDGGIVSIGSRSVTLDESPVLNANGDHGSNDYIEITFTDTGTGVPLDIQQKIFDPFFTTKERGKGTGFGLSTAYGFMQQSGGNIRVESVPGEGATFILTLPRISEQLLAPSENIDDNTETSRYNGTVLVVEDDEDVRDIASQTLLDAGYEVLLAENGNQGLEQFQKHRNIDLVFSDIIMPGGMTGVEMAQEIQRIKPIPVLLATGYAEKMLKDRVQENTNILCISKPYDTEELPRLIDSMLNEKAS